MVHTGDVRKRVLRAIEEARRVARDRRAQAAAAEGEGAHALANVVTPVFKTVASALTAEGYAFKVTTPSRAVRMEVSPQDFIEITMDTNRTPPALLGRVSRAWGRRVLVEELVVREAPELGTLSEDDVLDWTLAQIGPFVER